MTFVDTHAHLFYPDFAKDIAEVIQRALDAHVEYMIVPGTDAASSREAIDLAERFPSVYACVGFHPLDLAAANEKTTKEIEELSTHPKVVAIGEIGLDYYYDTSPREVQKTVFRNQLALAVRRNLPAVIHTRDSLYDTIEIVEEISRMNPEWCVRKGPSDNHLPGRRGVFHCFSGSVADARRLYHSGFLASFTGNVTFKKSTSLAVLKGVGYDHIMLETDAPYLSPIPYRGKRNEPSYIPMIARSIAEACGVEVSDVARTSSFNAFKLFSFGPPAKPVFTYQLGRALYINLTNRCNADCIFCDRKGEAVVKGYSLKIDREPSVEEIIKEIGDPKKYSEIVFCGYGEPTIRFDDLKEISRWVKEQGGRVRLNTDGHGNIINKRDITQELIGLVDSVSISLNSIDPIQYGELMQIDGPRFFAAMVDFARRAKQNVPEVIMSVVEINSIDVEAARKFAEEDIGILFRVRPYF